MKRARIGSAGRQVVTHLGAPLVLVAGACSVLDPTFAEPGLIIFHGDTAQLAAPIAIARGAAFQVSVQTFGGGCTRKIARTEQKSSGGLVEIRPYNETRRSDACTDDLMILTHSVTLQIDQVGPTTIRVIAEQRPMTGTGGGKGPARLERVVTVQ